MILALSHDDSVTGSKEEKKDLYEAFQSTRGSLAAILDSIPHSTTDDESRFIEIINTAIASDELTRTSEWVKSTGKDYEKGRKKRVAKEKKEAVEAEMAAKELGVWEAFYGNNRSAHGHPDKDLMTEGSVAGTSRDGKQAQKRKHKSKAADDTEPNNAEDSQEEDTSALQAMISARQNNRSRAMDALFAKYSAVTQDDDEEIDMKAGKKRQRKSHKEDAGGGEGEEQAMPPALVSSDRCLPTYSRKADWSTHLAGRC